MGDTPMMAAQTTLTLPDGRIVDLHRRPDHVQPDNLRAWDSADEYVLAHVAEHHGPGPEGPTVMAEAGCVISGDGFGALAVGLAERRPTWWSDSDVQASAARANLLANNLDPDTLTWLPSTQAPVGPIGLAIVKVPRSAALLEDLLSRLRPHLAPHAQVIGAGMTRNVHSRTVAAFTEMIGPTSTTRARKKARLILSSTLPGGGTTGAVAADTFSVDGLVVTTLPGVFSAGRLDPGTELLLASLPPVPAGADVVDLGCGSGVVGTRIARDQPRARLIFTDQSHLAVASARATWAAAHAEREATFHVADALDALADASADLVVVNPPFHQGHVEGDEVAWRMFGDARRVLRPGGQIVAVGNRHLAYHAKLQRLYGNATVLRSDGRFVVVASTRR